MKKKFIFLSIIIFMFFSNLVFSDQIHDLIKLGKLEKIRELFKNNKEIINLRHKDQNTPLHIAITENKLDIARFLIQNGAEIDAVNTTKSTPLHQAAYKGNAKAVELLLKMGADYKLRNMRFRIPLFLACNWGDDLDTVKLLVEAGSDVNDRNKRDEIILVSTLAYGKDEIINYLMDKGATFPDEKKILSRVIFMSVANGRLRPFRIAKTKMEKLKINWKKEVSMHTCARGGSIEIAKALLENKVDLEKKNKYGVAPIHIAAENGRVEFIQFLLKEGVKIDEKSLIGKTALHFAKEKKHKKTIQFLVNKGASQKPPIFPILKGDYLGQKKPGNIPEIFAPGIVSTHGFNSEHSPAVFSPSGKEVYWTKKFRGPILYMENTESGWTAPKRAPFNSKFGEGEPVFSPDGKRIYFLSMRPIKAGAKPGKENIWYIERVKLGWSDPKPVSSIINDCPLHWSFSISKKGNLYFASVLEEGFGSQDIYCSKFINGKYEKPKNLGKIINHKGIEHTPFVSPDESYLIFASTQGSASFRDLKFLISFKGNDGKWKKPVECDKNISKINFALCPQITPDQKYMFFIGNGDIFWVNTRFIEKLKQKK